MSSAAPFGSDGTPANHPVALWKEARWNYDALGRHAQAMDDIAPRVAERERIRQGVAAMADLRQHFPEFFAVFPYEWAWDEDTYDLAMEVEGQMRLFCLVIPCWTHKLPNMGIDESQFGRLFFRETLVARVGNSTPAAADLGGWGLITFPLGWFETVHYGLATASALLSNKSDEAASFVSELFLRTLADMSFQDLEGELGFSCTVDGVVIEAGRRALSAAMQSLKGAGRFPSFEVASGDLQPDALSGAWGDLAFAGVTFALAHEAAHVLTGEQFMGRAVAPDELRADELALMMTRFDPVWQREVPALGLQSPEALACVAATCFIFVNLLRLSLDKAISSTPGPLLDEFKARAAAVQELARRLRIDSAEAETISKLATLFTSTRGFYARWLESRCPGEITSLRTFFQQVWLEQLREQEPLGGVWGLPH